MPIPELIFSVLETYLTDLSNTVLNPCKYLKLAFVIFAWEYVVCHVTTVLLARCYSHFCTVFIGVWPDYSHSS